MLPKLPTGVDVFGDLVRGEYLFIDHSLMIHDFFSRGDKVTLTIRGRRWSKSLNLSMLHHFLAKEVGGQSTAKLFDKLAIAKVEEGEFLQKHQGQYPVIFLTFKGVKSDSAHNAIKQIKLLMQKLARSYERELLLSPQLTAYQKKLFTQYLEGELDEIQLQGGLTDFNELLFTHYKKPVYILIDEYDTPLNALHNNENELEALTHFLKLFLGNGLKSNPYLAQGFLTGILRLSKNNMLSDLNNLKIYSAFDKGYSEYYGFSEEEVNWLFQQCHLEHKIDEVKAWYNGYYSGPHVVYNPYSIIACLSENGALQPYWVMTSDDSLIKRVLSQASPEIKDKVRLLITGKSFEGKISPFVRFNELERDESALWSLLFHAGYLKMEAPQQIGLHYKGSLLIPNQEVSFNYQEIFSQLLVEQIGNQRYQQLLTSLTQGDLATFMDALSSYLNHTVSVRDFTDENAYHTFILGLISGLMDTHFVKSNREYGLGFTDILLIPKTEKDNRGIVLEFKHPKPESKKPVSKLSEAEKNKLLEKAAKEGLEQITKQGYTRAFEEYSYVQNITTIGLAMLGKSLKAFYQTSNLLTRETSSVISLSRNLSETVSTAQTSFFALASASGADSAGLGEAEGAELQGPPSKRPKTRRR